jgi:hypothetical protein
MFLFKIESGELLNEKESKGEYETKELMLDSFVNFATHG